jgi:exodeoxyribonuclease VII large subunit
MNYYQRVFVNIISLHFFKLQTMSNPYTDNIYSITELNRIVRGLLETRLTDIWIHGEVTNLSRPSSGHWYFTLKDGSAQIRCAMFRNRNQYLKFTPANGNKVQARGRVSLYETRGDYQFIIEECKPEGEGALQRAFEELKQRLWKEGLFDTQYKKPLPRFPQIIGVITSPTGAAVQDILNVLNRRFPLASIIIYPVPVQGIEASPKIAKMIEHADSRNECDVLLLSRGGGSIEDLWAFNEEAVANAIFKCRTPIVTGVGHEIDVTIADYISDLQAPTPSAAAELVAPLTEELQENIKQSIRTLTSKQLTYLEQVKEKLSWLKRTLNFHQPKIHIQHQIQQVDDLEQRLINRIPTLFQQHHNSIALAKHGLMKASPSQKIAQLRTEYSRLHQHLIQSNQVCLFNSQQKFNNAHIRLNLLSPKATLERGYTILYDEKSGQLIKRVEEIKAGQKVFGKVLNGEFSAIIKAVQQQKTPSGSMKETPSS